MARVPTSSSTVRLTLSSDLLADFLELSENFEIERTDLIDLLATIAWPPFGVEDEAEHDRILKRAERARWLLEGLITGNAKTRAQLEHSIEPPVNVTALRMGPRMPDSTTAGTAGYTREWKGMDLLDSPTDVWNQARGYWVAQPDAEYLVPARLSYAPYVFRTERWDRAVDSNRVWATQGKYIDFEKKLAVPLVDGDAHELESSLDYDSAEPATELDLVVAEALSGQQIAFSVGASNPVVRLRQRGKQLTPKP